MKLSSLQKFILVQSYGREKKISRGVFNRYYGSVLKGEDNIVKVISKSIERLIDKGLMVGFGEKTRDKWYIKEVQLTPAGRQLAKKLLGVQTKLPFGRSAKK